MTRCQAYLELSIPLNSLRKPTKSTAFIPASYLHTSFEINYSIKIINTHLNCSSQFPLHSILLSTITTNVFVFNDLKVSVNVRKWMQQMLWILMFPVLDTLFFYFLVMQNTQILNNFLHPNSIICGNMEEVETLDLILFSIRSPNSALNLSMNTVGSRYKNHMVFQMSSHTLFSISCMLNFAADGWLFRVY